ncbi:MAG: hypothetical protein M5U09_08570 [Gammaproteobacteria bacterium]|nr:hypothetical protein [Gammaproteobacteria bacterium]
MIAVAGYHVVRAIVDYVVATADDIVERFVDQSITGTGYVVETTFCKDGILRPAHGIAVAVADGVETAGDQGCRHPRRYH